MSKSDYLRPSEDQVNIVYRCQSCGYETEQSSCYGVGRCNCGGAFDVYGETYPASADDWNEERGRDGEWHGRY